MTGAGVENDIGAAAGQLAAGPVGHPGVFADFEADADAAALEHDVAQRHTAAGQFHFGRLPGRPGLKPTRLVVDALPCEILLGRQPQQFAVDRQGRRVEPPAAAQHRQPQRDDHPPRLGQNLVEHAGGHCHRGRRVKGVFTSVPGDAQLGQAEDAHAIGPGRFDRADDVGRISIPVERRLIQRGSGNFDELHVRSKKGTGAYIGQSRRFGMYVSCDNPVGPQ